MRREDACMKLVKFLTSKEENLRWRRETNILPARIDALEEIYPEGNPLHDAVMIAARQGRTYRSIPLWRRIESQLAQELGIIIGEVNKNPSIPSMDILRSRLEPLARRLNVTLEN
jgi:ABC-type glycerol-3-phosphate transport system substrate-binding protein